MRYEEAIAKHEPLSRYEQGLVDALYAFAWMKDGTYYVGSGVYTLGDAVDRKITEHRERSLEPRDDGQLALGADELQPETAVAPHRVDCLARVLAGFRWPDRGSFEKLKKRQREVCVSTARSALQELAVGA